jgi:hypothetical protein
MLEKFNDLNFKEKTTVICGIIILLVGILVMGNGNNKIELNSVPNINNEKIKEIMNKDLGEDYTLTIKETIGLTENKYIFYKDENLKLYESSDQKYGYLEYKGKFFQMDGETKELTRYTEDLPFLKNPHFDLELIKEFTNNCEYQYISQSSAKCDIKLKDYLTYHNNKYGTSYIGNDNNIVFTVTYSDKINEINIDYTAFNKTVNLSEENLNVNIKFRYNSNNFDIVYDNYQSILEG